MQLQFLAHLVRETRQCRVIEILAQHETFVAAVRFHVGSLAAEIDVVLRVNLKLGGDIGIECAERRPDPHQIGDTDFWIGQDFKGRATLAIATLSAWRLKVLRVRAASTASRIVDCWPNK